MVMLKLAARRRSRKTPGKGIYHHCYDEYNEYSTILSVTLLKPP
jgi:hypothetical protein